MKRKYSVLRIGYLKKKTSGLGFFGFCLMRMLRNKTERLLQFGKWMINVEAKNAIKEGENLDKNSFGTICQN